MGTVKVTIGVGDPQGRQFEDIEVTVNTGSTYWTLRILSGISEGICNTMVQSGGEFLYIGVGGR